MTQSPLFYQQHPSIFVSMTIQEKLGQRIKQLRQKKGLSQEQFAYLCELDRTYMTSVENGKRNVSLQNIKKIANALGVSISELFKGV